MQTLFAGLNRVHGSYTLSGESDDRGKVGGAAVTKHTPVTLALWEAHLQGQAGLGIVPIRDDNTCVFGVIDIDVYAELDHIAIAKNLERLSLPLVPIRSKSGGCHIYLFSTVPVAASLFRKKLQGVAAALGFGQSEIFPKQSKLMPTEGGSWINCPYFNAESLTCSRYALRADGYAFTLDEFLTHAEGLKVVAEFFAGKAPGALADGPPCLSHLIQIGIPEGGRNTFLSNMARYSKRANPTGWREDVEQHNRGCCSPPLPYNEVGEIVKSADKKDYGYSCSDTILAAHCARAVCRTQRFGVSNNNGETMPELGVLTKYVSDPPVRWVWEVDGVRLPLSTEELTNYRFFQKACVEHLTRILPDMKPADWKQIVAKAFETVHEERVSEDASVEAQFWHLLEKWCTGRAHALSLGEVTRGLPFTETGRTYFRLLDFKTFLSTQRFNDMTLQQMAATLKERGGACKHQRLEGRGSHRIWEIPAFGAGAAYDVPDSVTNSEFPY
jgi:hypothetical protein